MDKLSAADVLVELEALFNLHPSGAFPALALLYNGLRGQAAPGDPGMAENRLPQPSEMERAPMRTSPSPSHPADPSPRPSRACNRVQVVLGTRKCKSRSKRAAKPRTIINLQEDVPEELSSEEDTDEDRPAAKRFKGWRIISTVTLGDKPRDFIIQVAGACDRIDLNDIVRSLMSVESKTHIAPGSTLKDLTSQWTTYSGGKQVVLFWQAVIEITVSLRCQRYNKSPREVWDEKLSTPDLTPDEVRKQRRSFCRLCETGTKMCRLAAGGTFYLIPVLAFSGTISTIRDMACSDVNEVAMALREVKNDPTLQPLVERIIDTILGLRQCVNFQMHTIIDADNRKALGIPEVISLSEVDDSDRFFDSLSFRDFILPQRSTDFWDVNNDPVSRLHLALGSFDPVLEDIPTTTTHARHTTVGETVYIQCCLKPSGFVNKVFKGDMTRDTWTDHQRSKATGRNVHRFQSAEHLAAYLGNLSPLGKQENMLYYRISPGFENGKSVHVTGANGELLLLIIKSMPDEYRGKITSVINAVYPRDWKHAVFGETERVGFRADHFCVWNRYCENGKNAPEDVHQSHLMRLCQDTGCPRRHRIPHTSQDIFEDGGRIYGQLEAGLCDVFSWLADEIRGRLPDHYVRLSAVFGEIPFQQNLLSYPFTNLVVNLGAETSAHVDPQDDELCAVFPFGNWTGGELCLYEPGITLELRAGDVVLFPSNRITHFNLRMAGHRGSMVLNTDSHMKSWIKDRNGWGERIR